MLSVSVSVQRVFEYATESDVIVMKDDATIADMDDASSTKPLLVVLLIVTCI